MSLWMQRIQPGASSGGAPWLGRLSLADGAESRRGALASMKEAMLNLSDVERKRGGRGGPFQQEHNSPKGCWVDWG